jgi:uncharacterized membrane protein YqaE (UPF0057 family)
VLGDLAKKVVTFLFDTSFLEISSFQRRQTQGFTIFLPKFAQTFLPLSMGVLVTIVLLIVAIFLPPLAVFFRVGIRGPFWLNIILTILGWLPGIVHAWYVVLTKRHRRI